MNNNIAIKIFISYSHKDESLCKELLNHLSPLIRSGIINEWYDRKIIPGEDWDLIIKEELVSSDIVLFLVSSDFLSSDYIFENEIQTSLELKEKEEIEIVPIMLRTCDIGSTALKDLQGLPKDFKPVVSWFSTDDALFNVVTGLKSIIKKVRRQKEIIVQNNSKTETLTKLDIQLIQRDLKNIGLDLHDNVSSRLYMTQVFLSKIKSILNTDDELNLLNEVELNISEIRNSIRQISHSIIRGTENNDFDLKEAILDLERQLIQTGDISVRIVFEAVDDIINSQLKTSLYRILQELISNVTQHSRATELTVELKNKKSEVILMVADNGIGIDGKKDDYSRGIGFDNIKSRVDFFKGDLDIKSSKNNGTIVKIVIPITTANTVYN